VSDAVRLLWLARHACSPKCPAVNGGTGEGMSVVDVASAVCGAWGAPVEVRFSGVGRPGDPERLVADTARALSLSFVPSVPFARGIAQTVEWFRSRTARSLSTDERGSHAR
jgi:UDP-glucose 4-epimerase